jgi:glycosyltransferase involved in cell wall biosynthesis
MKIVLVSNGFPPSGQWGTEYYTHQLATGLAARGHRVTVFCPIRDGSKPRYTIERCERYGVDLVEVHNAGDPRKVFADSYQNERIEAIFDALLAEISPDAVHFMHLLWGLSARLPLTCARRKVPTLVTLTDFGLLCHRGQLFDHRLEQCGGPHDAATCARCIREPGSFDARRPARKAKSSLAHLLAAAGGFGLVVTRKDIEARERAIAEVLRRVDHFVAPTRIMAYTFLRAGVSRERMTQLYYGIDERPYLAARRSAETKVFRFGYLGQFEPHKGLHRLFEAVALLQHRLPESIEPWSVHLFGNPVGGRNRFYVDWSWRTELSERIRFRGSFEPLQAPRILASLDALVVPSQWAENAPLTVLQARIAGLPVIACDVPGIRELVEPYAHGVLVDPKDAHALAEAMGKLAIARPAPDRASRPPISHDEHLTRIEDLYALVRGETPRTRRAVHEDGVLVG